MILLCLGYAELKIEYHKKLNSEKIKFFILYQTLSQKPLTSTVINML